jgi:F-type H+-transporting ATPase subunit gamma
MQMVAAAKLRRAQEAAEAARPYAERMEARAGQPARTPRTGDDAPPLLAGTGKDEVHLLVVCTAERGLCGGFNSSIAQACAHKIMELNRRRQDGEDHHRRQEGPRQLKRDYADVRSTIDLRGRQADRLRERRRDRPKIMRRCSTTASSTSAHLFFSASSR